jgi:hypothetical protein
VRTGKIRESCRVISCVITRGYHTRSVAPTPDRQRPPVPNAPSIVVDRSFSEIRAQSFVSQSDDRIDTHRAARRDQASHRTGQGQHAGGDDKRDGVGRRNVH